MKPLIVALDVETDTEALALVKDLRSHVDLFKVGPVLFLKYGGALLSQIKALGAEIFLDMKFHDIPSVVAKAIARAGEWGVYSATLHISGGKGMMMEAVAVPNRPKLWGVTILTSLDEKDLKSMGLSRTVANQALALAHMAAECKLDGIICSVREASSIKKDCGNDFQVVTPGIRLENSGDDQKRVETPSEAIKQGADYFVMGRPVVESASPLETVKEIYQSMKVTR